MEPAPKRVLVGAGAAERLDEARSFLNAALADGNEVLILATARGAADDLLREACPAGGGLFGVHRTTPLQLATELATRAMAEKGLAPVSRLGVEALAARSIALSRREAPLSYFEPVAEMPGLARALARTLYELRSHRVTGEDLNAAGPPGEDLARLLAAYESALERRGLADDALLLDLGRAALEGGRLERESFHDLVGLPLLALDLSPTTIVEIDFLAALAGHAQNALATAPAGDDEGRDGLVKAFGVDPQNLAGEDGTNPLARLRRRLFAADIDPPEDEAPAEDDESVVLLTAAGEGRECVEIARRIRDYAADGERYDSMAILLRDPENYLPLVEEAMRRARIPAFFTRGTVRPDASGRAFLALLACASEGFSASRFAEYLSLGRVPDVDEEGQPPPVVEVPWVETSGDQMVFKSLMPQTEEDEPPADPDAPVVAGTLRTPRRWEELLVDASVLGGRDRWQRRLKGLANEMELQIRELEEEPARRERLERRLGLLHNLERFALPIIDDLDALPREAPWGVWLDALGRLAARVLRYSERVLTVLSELRPMEEVESVTLDEVRRVLEERLTFLRTDQPTRRYGQVFIGTIEEARGRVFDTVFLPGLAEGLFPRRATEDPLLLDEKRRLVNPALLTQQQRAQQERLLLRIAAGAAGKRFVVSYPNLDTIQGRARVPSFYALDVLRAAEGRLPKLRELESRAALKAASILGWPAPRDPNKAIDDAEYDLSLLEGLLGQRTAQTTSRGRYLLEWNEPLKRSLRSRFMRWRAGSQISWADGLVASDEATLKVLEDSRPRQRSFSPTALQNFAVCPYKFLLYSILRLRPREEAAPLEQMDPLTRGSIFHEVQYHLFGKLRERNLLPMRAADADLLFTLADETLADAAKRYFEKLAPAIPQVWESEIEGLRTDLRGWIRTVLAMDSRSDQTWRPAHFELSFGMSLQGMQDEHDPASREDEARILDGVRLRGSIDLVEADDERQRLRVTDHKTGRALRADRLAVGGGETLQPLLYALVAEEVLDRPVDAGRLFYCTRRGEFQELVVPLNEANRKAINQVVDTVDRAVADGFLPAAPRKKACTFCDYQLVCGPNEEMRMERKRKDKLIDLNDLRRMS